MELELKKRKRKRKLLLTDFECLTDDERLLTITEIRQRIKKIFKQYIGEENFITPVEVFERVYNIHPEQMDIFKKNYYWQVIRNVIRQLRREEILFIVNKGSRLFVLKSKTELKAFEKKINLDIENMIQLKVKAKRWVNNEKWKTI
jgi:hypothetical protein